MLTDFLEWTAWKMTPPAAYGTFHLTFFIVGLAVCIVLAYLLRKSTDQQFNAVLFTAGMLLFISEIYKQLFYTYVLGGGKYQWWIFPFQLCSIPMYFCLIIPFIRNGKIKDAMLDFMLSFNLMGGFVAFLEPSGLVHEYWSLTIHAFCWHMLLILVGLVIGFSRRAGRKLSDYRRTVVTFALLCAVAFLINLIFRRVSGGDINMFYVGPSNSPIIVFKDICEKYGWYVNTPLYMIAMCAGAFIFYFPFCLWNRKRNKK